MKIARSLIPTGLLLLACAFAAAQSVHSDYNHNVDFSQFHTYCWAKVQTENQLWQPRIEAAVDEVLQNKGWHRVKSGGQVGSLLSDPSTTGRNIRRSTTTSPRAGLGVVSGRRRLLRFRTIAPERWSLTSMRPRTNA